METTTTENPISNEQPNGSNGTSKTIPSFEGPELSIEFKKESPDGSTTLPSSFVTFVPRQLLRGENKWSYPFPALALSEEVTMADFLQHFGEDFCFDLFIDALGSHCQSRWRQAVEKEGDAKTNFIEGFFITRRDTGPTAAKLGILLQKKLTAHKTLKQTKGKDHPEVIQSALEIKKLREEQNLLFEKEMQ